MAKISGRWKFTKGDDGKIKMERAPRKLDTSAQIRAKKSKKQKVVRPGSIR
jgi:hypothetical protein